jgi:hypothetical protein
VNYAPHAAAIAKAAIEAGHPVPSDCFPPEVPEEARFAYTAYHRLATDRDSMGSRRIRYSAIDAYASRYGVKDIDEFDVFLSLITSLDQDYLELLSEKERTDANRGAD